MFSKMQRLIKSVLVVVCLLTSTAGQARQNTDVAKLHINPQQCVAMVKGQDCYANVEIDWQAPDKGAYCLFSSLQSKPIRCWSMDNSGNIEYEVQSNENVLFSLKIKNTNNVLASAELEMAWVYKKGKRPHSSWRVF